MWPRFALPFKYVMKLGFYRNEQVFHIIRFVLKVTNSEAKMTLNSNQWKVDETIRHLATRPPKPASPPIALSGANTFVFCEVCAVNQAVSSFSFLSCLHHFCKGCWELHFECQILQGISTSKNHQCIFKRRLIVRALISFCRFIMHVCKL